MNLVISWHTARATDVELRELPREANARECKSVA